MDVQAIGLVSAPPEVVGGAADEAVAEVALLPQETYATVVESLVILPKIVNFRKMPFL